MGLCDGWIDFRLSGFWISDNGPFVNSAIFEIFG